MRNFSQSVIAPSAPILALLAIAPISAAQTCGSPWSTYQGIGPSARYGAAMAFDSDRGRVVLFGGRNGANYFGDTWEWTAAGPAGGGAWTQIAAAGPSPLSGASMAYDSTRHRTVLFGGYNASSTLNQTWEWDGATWTLMQPAQSPPPQSDGLASFDLFRTRTVLLITVWTTPEHGETWEYDGATWVHSPDFTPTPYDGSMTFDAARSIMVMKTGDYYNPSFWERSISGWQQVSTDLPYTSYAVSYRLAYDAGLGKVVFLGLPSAPASVWALHPPTGHWWIMNSGGPVAQDTLPIVYDGAGHQILAFGGTSNPSSQTVMVRTDVTSGPVITVRPMNLALFDHWFAGSLHVEATGAGSLGFHWRRNGQYITDGGAYSGTTTPDLLINPINTSVGGSFDVAITDECGTTISPAVSVHVNCYADCDAYCNPPPCLSANDFQCFLNSFAAGTSYANCDMSTAPPVLNANDFQCFLNRFATGCP